MKKVKIIFVLVGLFSLNSYAQSKEYISKINDILNSFKDDTALSHATWGFCLINDKTGEIVAERDAKRTIQPASTMKVLTTGAALSILGSDYTFKTTLGYIGTIDKSGTLNGKLCIVGSGDPTLGFARIPGVKDENSLTDGWVKAVAKAGIKEAHQLIADDTHFETAMQPAAWAWDDIGNYYGAGPSGLTFHENQYNLYLRQGKKPGDATEFIETKPDIQMDFNNEIKAGNYGSGDEGYIYCAPYETFEGYLRGTIPPGDSVFVLKGAIPDPPQLLSFYFWDKLRTVYSEEKFKPIARTTERVGEPLSNIIATELSPPLKTIVLYTNLYSINLYAETLLKEIGYKVNGIGSTNDGLRALKSFWQKKGLDLSGLFIRDGSGLSRYDAVTPEQFAKAMHIMRSEKCFTDFYTSLPVAGRTGSLYGIGKGTLAEGNIHAKSGYMTRVRSYAGYVRSKEGQDYSFSFIINNYSESAYSVKMKIEKLLVALAE